METAVSYLQRLELSPRPNKSHQRILRMLLNFRGVWMDSATMSRMLEDRQSPNPYFVGMNWARRARELAAMGVVERITGKGHKQTMWRVPDGV
jgi:hypothetical protein